MIVAVPVGLILIQLYEAGAFDHVIESCRELAADIHTLRRGRIKLRMQLTEVLS